jgi:hypothetical protein
MFRALPAGIVNTKYSDIYTGINEYCYFYTSDIGNIVIRFDSELVGVYDKNSNWNGWEFYSIRCVKD